LKKLSLYVVMLGVLAVLPLVFPNEYTLHLLILAAINIVFASSLNLISGYVGELSLGHAAFAGLGAYATALLTLRGYSPWLGLLAAVAVTGVSAYLIGLVVIRLRGAYFVISSLAFQMTMFFIASNWLTVTHGPMGLLGIPKPKLWLPGIGSIELVSKMDFYYLSVIVAIVVVIACNRLVKAPIGESWVAIRENEKLSAAVGIDRTRYVRIAFMFAAGFAGVGGWLLAHYITVVSPHDNMSFDVIIGFILMVVIGGRGTIVGPVIGAVVVTFLPEYLRALGNWRLTVYGVILALLVIFLPRGFMQLWEMVYSRLQPLVVAALPIKRRE